MLRSGLIYLIAVMILATSIFFPSAAAGEYVSCPGQPAVKCIPGKVAGRIVCAWGGDLLEYENVTAFCLACHSQEGDRENQLLGRMASPNMQWGHAMEVEYPAKRKGFTPPSELFEAIKLTNGRVTCESCHGGSSKSNHFLSVHPRQPNLCLHCHHK